jgi:hypothetical protein
MNLELCVVLTATSEVQVNVNLNFGLNVTTVRKITQTQGGPKPFLRIDESKMMVGRP